MILPRFCFLEMKNYSFLLSCQEFYKMSSTGFREYVKFTNFMILSRRLEDVLTSKGVFNKMIFNKTTRKRLDVIKASRRGLGRVYCETIHAFLKFPIKYMSNDSHL